MNGSAAGREQLCAGRPVAAARRWRTKPFYVRENYAKCASLELPQVQAVEHMRLCGAVVLRRMGSTE